MSKARVIVTYKCNRNCPNCCNDFISDVPSARFEDLLKYEEITITGGEPMLLAARVVEMIHRLRNHGFVGKIWLYTADINLNRWADKTVLKEVAGITYTLHFKPTERDFAKASHLNKFILENLDNRNNERSDRMLVDSRAWSESLKIVAKDVGTGHWTSFRPLEWKDADCPVADGEELVFYDLESEG